MSGVYVEDVNKNGAAAEAGMLAGDVIVAINGNKVKNTSQLQEQVARYKPNDKIRVTYYRKEQEKTVTVTLKSIEEVKVPIVRKKDSVEIGGAIFGNIDQATQKHLKITGGVLIKVLKAGPWKQAGITQDFVITHIDGELVEDLDQLVNILNRKERGIWVDGLYPNGTKGYYGVNLGTQ